MPNRTAPRDQPPQWEQRQAHRRRALTLDIPRDREGTFEPQLIGKYERRFTGFDDKILALYAAG
jgi:transposase-like protein